MTVSGPISPSSLGFCHSHEHLFLANGRSAELNPSLHMDDYKKTLDELLLFKAVGGNAIVDAQPVGCGRMAALLEKSSVESGIHVIASTGFHKLCFYPDDHWIHQLSGTKLAQLFIDEYEQGMYIDADEHHPTRRTYARPGAIKTASDSQGVKGAYKRLFVSAFEASRETGLPVISHTEMGVGALEQVKLFLDHGIPTQSIIICHLDRNVQDINYHLEVAKSGVYLEFDTIGRFKYHSDEEEAKLIITMVEHGYENQILIGLDTTRERLKSYGGTLGLDYISKTFIPLLRNYGLPESAIEKFTVGNPSRAFINYKGAH
jgi:phosphotriesterase-related protein